MIDKSLYLEIEKAGFRVKTFKIEHLKEISTHFEELVSQGILDKDFYSDNLTNFNYDCESMLENAKSVILIASPQCKSIAEFEYEGSTISAVIPPTYKYPEIISKEAEILNNVLVKNGYGFVKPVLPLKLLAVRSGLGQYGRNNVCYVSGLGSFIRLAAYITDHEFAEDSWGGVRVMESCSSCSLCIDNCPTGAIDKERFLIHAQNCITNLNEYETPMPEWVKPQWHDSIVGCMKCQAVCPHNRKLIDLVDERICFSDKETGWILEGMDFEGLDMESKEKLRHAGLEDYYKVLPRNIRLLMNR